MERPLSSTAARQFLARHVHGDGIEVGPGQHPFPLPPATRLRYVDRWRPDDARARFPELGDAPLLMPDVLVDLDRDRLAPIAGASCDVVICSHVIEHLAEPIGFLADVHRTLRVGGHLVLMIPDRRRTFDAARDPTPLAHLVAEHAAGVTQVDDDHLVDFLTRAGAGAAFLGVPDEAGERGRWFTWHRERSIHAHCWSEDEFPAVIAHTIGSLGLEWELVDAIATGAQGAAGIEFGYVLRRTPGRSPRTERAAVFLRDLAAWRNSGRMLWSRPPAAAAARVTLAVDAPQAGAVVTAPFILGGWASGERRSGAGVELVEAWAVGESGGEHFLGWAPTGGARPDVARAIGVHAANAGYTMSVAGLPPGTYQLTVAARGTARDVVAVDERRVTVG